MQHRILSETSPSLFTPCELVMSSPYRSRDFRGSLRLCMRCDCTRFLHIWFLHAERLPTLSGYSALLTIQTARVSRGNSRESVTLITWDVGCDQCVVIFFFIFFIFFFIRWLLLYPTSDGCLLSSVPFGGNVVCLKHLNKIYQDLF